MKKNNDFRLLTLDELLEMFYSWEREREFLATVKNKAS